MDPGSTASTLHPLSTSPSTMQVGRADTSSENVLTVAGEVGPDQTAELRHRLLEALQDGDRDLLMDAREVVAFDDAAQEALSAARSYAKYHRLRLAVVDGPDGVTRAGLRRTGLLFRLPVYADPQAATAGLAGDRSTLAGRMGDVRSRLRPPAETPIAEDIS